MHRDWRIPLIWSLLIALGALSAVWVYRSAGLDWMKIAWRRTPPAPVVELTPAETSQLRQHGIPW